jgi:hypothetical protein
VSVHGFHQLASSVRAFSSESRVMLRGSAPYAESSVAMSCSVCACRPFSMCPILGAPMSVSAAALATESRASLRIRVSSVPISQRSGAGWWCEGTAMASSHLS